MIKKINKFIDSLNTEKHSKYYLYSQIIKNERAKRKLTLAEISKGICSISYLCKFEKNDIIADESYIRAIFERVDLDFNLVGKNILENGVGNALKAFLANDAEEIEILYNSTDDSIFNAQNYLIKGFYYLVFKKFEEFNQVIKALDNIKETLYLDDVGVFMFLVVQYYIDTYQFEEAKKVLIEIDLLSFKLSELNWLIDEQNFKVGFYLKDYNLMYKYYFKILMNNNIGYPIYRKVFLRAKYLYAFSSTSFKKAYAEFMQLNYKNIPEDYHLDITYWKIAILIKGKMYLKAFDEIYNNGLYYDVRFVGLLLLCAFCLGNDNYIEIACKVTEEFQINSEDKMDNRFIKFMLLFLKGQYSHEYIEFIKEKVLPFRKKFTHHIYEPFYLHHYLDYLKNGSRYKEAFLLLYEKFLSEKD